MQNRTDRGSKNSLRRLFFSLLLTLLVSGCASRKNVIILKDIDKARIENAAIFNTRIMRDDKLSIIVSCADVEVSQPYNTPMTGLIGQGGNYIGNSGITPGYIVDRNGCIDFPTLGRIKVDGMSRDELVDLLQARLSEQIKDPTVTVQFMNYRITLLGAVRSPGTYTIGTERISVLDAIGMAGDLQMKSRRNNVLVVRDKGGEVLHGRLNLQSSSIFTSDFYYLQQNDVVYVEPTRGGIRDGSTSSFLPYLLGTVSSIISLVAIFINIK